MVDQVNIVAKKLYILTIQNHDSSLAFHFRQHTEEEDQKD